MKSIRQLTRQGLKTLAGILLAAIAAAVLGISFSQKLAAADTARQLRQIYMTVALPTGLNVSNRQEWIRQLMEERPDLISGSIQQGFSSAYIADLTPDNYTQHKNENDDAYDMTNANLQPTTLSYGGAMLEILLETYTNDPVVQSENADSFTYQLEGEVIRVIGLQEGYYDPTGFTIRIHVTVPAAEDFAALNLEPGQRYLVYGCDYQDLDWQLRDDICEIMTWRYEETLPEWDLSTFAPLRHHGTGAIYRCRIGDLYHGLSAAEMEMFRTATLTAIDLSQWQTQGGDDTYAVPTIIRLDGAVEDFLSSAEGALWQRTLDDININCHTFPIIGTDNLQSIASFSLGRADIPYGRGFTADEINSGAKVCVISRSLADAHGLEVGDTLVLNYYTFDYDNPYQQFISQGEGIVNPAGYAFYSPTMQMLSDETYTIVGLYEQDSPWGSVENDVYCFTPNTIFVPRTSITGSVDYTYEGQFLTLIVHSDKLRQLQALSVDESMDGIFEYYDNGYNALADKLTNFEAAADRILPIGVAVYIIIVLLFLFLFPAREDRTFSQMDSIGSGHFRRILHLLLSTLGIWIPGSALGTGVAIAMWQTISDALQGFMQTDVTICLDTTRLWSVAAMQTAAVAAATVILGIYMSCRVNPMNKR